MHLRIWVLHTFILTKCQFIGECENVPLCLFLRFSMPMPRRNALDPALLVCEWLWDTDVLFCWRLRHFLQINSMRNLHFYRMPMSHLETKSLQNQIKSGIEMWPEDLIWKWKKRHVINPVIKRNCHSLCAFMSFSKQKTSKRRSCKVPWARKKKCKMSTKN